MLNKYPLWKYLLILFVVTFASIYASPVLFSEDPALQISGADASVQPNASTLRKVKKIIQKNGQQASQAELDGSTILIRFQDPEVRNDLKKVLSESLGDDYLVALNRAQNTPEWLQNIGASPMNLGLDLRGGVHFLLEVDLSRVLSSHLNSYSSAIKKELREEGLKYHKIDTASQQLVVRFAEEAQREAAKTFIGRNFPDFSITPASLNGEYVLRMELSNVKLKEIRDYAITQNLSALRNRVNALGVSEPIVQRQGASRIVVELPGIQDTASAKRIIGKTASLEFRLEDSSRTGRSAVYGPTPPGSERFNWKDQTRPPVLVKKRVIVKGDRVIDARSGFDENGQPQVSIRLDSRGGKQMHAVTSKNIEKAMVVIFVESKTKLKEIEVNGELIKKPITTEEKYVINVATIKDALGYNFRITGLDSMAESQELALLLRAGALAAPMYFVEERTVGPSLGEENIAAGLNSIIFGFVAVMIFMVAYYKVFGLIANVALVLNLVLLVALMSLLGATLTLPGMAGFVLLGGMAVDANVIIFSRIKEELARGESPQTAIAAGYDRAFSAIIDANLTTIAVAGVLFLMAAGSVQGFAVTLFFGIISSLFTSIMVTRALVNLIYGGRQLKTLRI